jgi:hypothetical protein
VAWSVTHKGTWLPPPFRSTFRFHLESVESGLRLQRWGPVLFGCRGGGVLVACGVDRFFVQSCWQLNPQGHLISAHPFTWLFRGFTC